MSPRHAIDGMLSRLKADIPALLENRDEFLREFECRAMYVLGEAAPEDNAYVQAALEDMIVQSGIDV